jgi:hypothetical protein
MSRTTRVLSFAVSLVAVPFLFSLSASADHLDFNEQWGKKYGYRSEVAVPVQNDDLVSIFWLGRSAGAEAFGKAWDAWRSELTDPKSLASKLQARFSKCSDSESRSGFELY